MNRPKVNCEQPLREPAQSMLAQPPSQIWSHLTADQRQRVLQTLTRACRLLAQQALGQAVPHER
jgi:hypothetical protein